MIDYLKGFYDARNLIWEAKKEQLEKLEPCLKQNCGVKSFNQEFRTITLDYGRRTGKTYWVVNKCYELSVNQKNSCFYFSIVQQHIDLFWGEMSKKAQRKMSPNSTNISTYTFHTIKNGIKYIPNSYAFVDISCMIGANQLDQIMQSNQWEIICLL